MKNNSIFAEELFAYLTGLRSFIAENKCAGEVYEFTFDYGCREECLVPMRRISDYVLRLFFLMEKYPDEFREFTDYYYENYQGN